MQLKGKTILVTGATGGIGTEVCRLLAGEGATLVLNCVSQELLADLLDKLGEGHHPVAADVASAEGRQAILAACLAAGGIDGMINLAGVLDFRLFGEQSESAINRMLQINAVAPILLSRLLLPQLLARPCARIVNVGSIFGSIGHPGFVTYCASKAALKTFSEALARELADTCVSVAYIAPRATSTALNSDRVMALNEALGNASDPPAQVAAQIVAMLRGTARLRYLGWPEKLFVRLNALLPAVVHSALVRKLPLIKHHAQV
jgi:short-subunit dehydrogenase